MPKSRAKRQKDHRAMVSELGKHNNAQLNAEIVRANDLKAKLDRGEDLSPADEEWLLRMDPTGKSAEKLADITTPYAHITLNADGKVTGYKNTETGYEGVLTPGGGSFTTLYPTKRMALHSTIVDEAGLEIVSEGPAMTPLNGHTVEEALLANEVRNCLRSDQDLTTEMSKFMNDRGWDIRIPITASDIQKMDKAKRLRRYRENATLIDELHDVKTSTAPFKPDLAKRIREAMYGAHKFVLTSEAAQKVGEAIRAYPEMLVINGQFAIPPFPITWIEMPTQSLIRGLGMEYGPGQPKTDLSIGYLIVGDKAYCAANVDDEEAIFLPIEYHLNSPMSPQAEKAFCDFYKVSRTSIDKFLWGGTFSSFVKGKRALRANHTVRMVQRDRGLIEDPTHWRNLLSGSAGDLRNILGILLMLNQPAKYIRTFDQRQKRSISSKGPKVYMAHSTIELTLNRRPIRQLLTRNKEKGTHASPRWHPVKGHLCQDKVAREGGCDHGGGEWWCEYEPRKWECLECGGKRWWREFPNGRGSAAIGFVDSTHRVKP